MDAESLFPPISREAIRAARARLAFDGLSIEDWAKEHGYNAKTVYQVLSGTRRCIRGTSYRIAIALGLRSHPDSHIAAASPAPSIADSAAPDAGNRGTFLPLGEPVR